MQTSSRLHGWLTSCRFAIAKPAVYSKGWAAGVPVGGLSPLGLLLSVNLAIFIYRVAWRLVVPEEAQPRDAIDTRTLQFTYAYLQAHHGAALSAAKADLAEYTFRLQALAAASWWTLGPAFGAASWITQSSADRRWKTDLAIGNTGAAVLAFVLLAGGAVALVAPDNLTNIVFSLLLMAHFAAHAWLTRTGGLGGRTLRCLLLFGACTITFFAFLEIVRALAIWDLPFL